MICDQEIIWTTSKEDSVDKPIDNYWEKRLRDPKTALESNNFEGSKLY